MHPDVLALFDLDNTLLPFDTDEQWVRFMLDCMELDAVEYAAASDDLARRYKRGEAGAYEFTEFYVSVLRGRSLVDMHRLHERFMAERVRPAVDDRARALVEKHKGLGHMVVLTTATSRFLSGPIAAELGFEHHIATELEIANDAFTGRILGPPNMREGKVERLLTWLASRGLRLANFRETWFYSDSQNDIPLLSHVTHPVAVNPDMVLAAHARHHGWPQISLGDA